MNTPDKYLLANIIDFADDNDLSLEQAASHLARYAQQRIPEYRIEQQASMTRTKITRDVASGPKESLIARILIRSRIHSVSWTYYPEYHVIDSPYETHWYSIWYRMPVWESFSEKKAHYIDDLFYDEEQEQFWMPEPYLAGLPSSKALFAHFTSKNLETLAGTPFHKVDPHIMAEFLQERKNTPIYSLRQGDRNKLGRRRPYGSKGWQDRIKHVSKYERITK
ncbi:MAG: hypothetical protein JJU29_23730 [Verrucomicrobia bacterium]|nr:hypothetical protein [Verrucomicrobiota bacterium]MCH8513490.1 hypothetical protein [Kiritimatiellia bacterium]